MIEKEAEGFEVFPWSRNMETGLPLVDEQHRQLILLLNRLAGALIYNSDVELASVFDELAAYAKYHFTAEEEIWANCFGSDKWAVEHHHVHESFLPAVLRIKEANSHLPLKDVVRRVVLFLVNWLAYHILNSDKRMAVATQAAERGMTLENAKQFADDAMSGAVEMMIETVLTMYEALSSRTILLMREREMRRSYEAELIRARSEAEAATRAKSDFLASMSHEIRTPMNGILGLLEVLQHGEMAEDQRETVDIIFRSASNLLSIIDDILDFSKIEAGKLELAVETFDPVENIRFSCLLLDKIAHDRNVRLTLFTEAGLPQTCDGDPLRINQVLTNIVGNAIKFSAGLDHPGIVRISLRPAVLSEGRRGYEILVEDNGVGISKDALARLFQPYEQAEATTTRRFGGTGLGLNISRNLVAMMGGEIDLQSEVGVGTRAAIRLPLINGANLLAPQAISFAGLTAFVVEDNGGLERNILGYLAHAGVNVSHLPDLAAAITAAQALPSDKRACILVAETESSVELPLLNGDAAGVPIVRLVPRISGVSRQSLNQRDTAGNAILASDLLTNAEFLVALDAAISRTETATAAPDPVTPKSLASKSAPALRILIVDDNEINQTVLLRQLELLGYRADIAGSGVEALQKWQSEAYDLVISDLYMPEMDGIELTQAIRRNEAETGRGPVRIVALTANVLQSEEDKCRSIGMDDYLSKPLSLQRLKGVLEGLEPDHRA